jgi:regulator of sigma E protease
MLTTWFESIVPFVAILVFLVVMHELGHFVTAKLAGVKVLEAGLGYPPRLWGKKIGETEYTINALPLGGFVRMLGETDAEEVDTSEEGTRAGVMNTTAVQRSGVAGPRTLAAQSAGVRIIVLSAGVIVNALLPVFFFSLNYMVPQTVSVGQAAIERVSPDTPAERAGLKADDIIVKVNGRKIQNVSDVSKNIALNQGTTMDWVIKRKGVLMDVHPYARWAVPTEVEPDGTKVKQGPTGIKIGALTAYTEKQSYNPLESVRLGVRDTYDSMVLVKNQIISYFASRSAPTVSGPVGIAQATGQVVKEAGWSALLQLAAVLSINLALLNMLPIPMLDGGRVLFVVVEVLRRGKRIAPEREALVHLIGFAVLMSLVLLISAADIIRIVNGESLVK